MNASAWPTVSSDVASSDARESIALAFDTLARRE